MAYETMDQAWEMCAKTCLPSDAPEYLSYVAKMFFCAGCGAMLVMLNSAAKEDEDDKTFHDYCDALLVDIRKEMKH